MSVSELMKVWRREQASISEAVARHNPRDVSFQNTLIDAHTDAKLNQALDEPNEAFRQRSHVRARILSKYIKQLM